MVTKQTKAATAKKPVAKKGVAAKSKAQIKRTPVKKTATTQKHAGGRPSKYTPEIVEKMNSFFYLSESTQTYEKVIDGGDRPKTVLIPNRLPTMERFAVQNNLSFETLRAWSKEVKEDGSLMYPEFSAAYSRAMDVQKVFLLEAGFAGASNQNITKFILSANHGMREVVEVEQTVKSADYDVLEDKYAQAEAERKRMKQEIESRKERLK